MTIITEYSERAIIIITVGQLIAANVQAKLVDTVRGEFTWTVELSPSGNPPATHYWCNWQMKPGELIQLKHLLESIPGHNEQVFELSDSDPKIARPTPDEILQMTTPKLKVVEYEL